MSRRLRLLSLYLRRIEKPWLGRATEPARLRAAFERSSRLFRCPPGLLALDDRPGGVPALRVACQPRGTGLILYLHGGAYFMGSPRTHRALGARLAQATGAEVVLPDYRLAPEHRFPAAPEDALAAWQGLLDRGYPAGRIVLAGDSAGGGLALALLAMILADGGPAPAGLVAFSPWTDLALSGASHVENAERDCLLPGWRGEEARTLYLDGADPRDPRASPLFADFAGAPPVHLQASRTELLRDDCLEMARRLQAGGAEVSLDIWDDAPHVLPIFQGWLPEADAALARAARFIAERLRAPRPAGS